MIIHTNIPIGMGTLLNLINTIAYNGPSSVYGLNANFIRTVLDTLCIDRSLINLNNYTKDEDGKVPDIINLFSPYYKVTKVKLFDREFNIERKRKPAVGLCFCDPYISDDVIANINNKEWPYYRYWPLEYYKELFLMCRNFGYDVVTFDSFYIPFEQKVFQLSQMCDFIITYEGGIAHLSRMLDIPCLYLPPRVDNNLYMKFHNEIVTLGRNAYYIESPWEFLSISKKQLQILIEDCKDGYTNNKFVTEQYKVSINKNLSKFNILDTSTNSYVHHTSPFIGIPENYLKQIKNKSRLGGLVEYQLLKEEL